MINGKKLTQKETVKVGGKPQKMCQTSTKSFKLVKELLQHERFWLNLARFECEQVEKNEVPMPRKTN